MLFRVYCFDRELGDRFGGILVDGEATALAVAADLAKAWLEEAVAPAASGEAQVFRNRSDFEVHVEPVRSSLAAAAEVAAAA